MELAERTIPATKSVPVPDDTSTHDTHALLDDIMGRILPYTNRVRQKERQEGIVAVGRGAAEIARPGGQGMS